MASSPGTRQFDYVIGVDVGTGSARAGVFDSVGHMLGSSKQDITLFTATGSIVEQSSDEIWQAVCSCVRGAMAQSGISPDQVAGIGFDATCSLVVLGDGGTSLPVGPSDDAARNVIVWMDHRAVAQTDRINATGHDVLKYVGGRISPEMETPKLLWLLENKPRVFAQAWQFLDLTDFLTWRASGDLARSTCTVTCKWTYLAHEDRWDPSYFRAIGLDVLANEDFERIGRRVVAPGTSLGNGLTATAAAELGLRTGTAVAAGLIDAHAGGLGTVGIGGDLFAAMGYVFGTSSCTMTSTREPVFVPGVWGPYFSAMVPNTWLNEGGQSVAGAAIERLLAMHPMATEARRQAEESGQSLPAMLAGLATQRATGGNLSQTAWLADGLHVVPEFLGNRAPMADPHAKAVIAGLGMETDMESLIALYIAAVCGIAYGLRQIIDTQAKAGAPIQWIVISGGAGRRDLVRQLLADATGKRVLTTDVDEPVLLGAAMLGSVAAGVHGDVGTAMAGMSRAGKTFEPSGGAASLLHQARYRAFEQLQRLARQLRQDNS